jgi:hypothetical protein
VSHDSGGSSDEDWHPLTLRIEVRIMPPMTDIDRLLALTCAYCAATSLSEARVSTLFLKGGSRIASLRAGGDMGSRTIARAIAAFDAAWPPDAVWPADVPRPSLAASSPVFCDAATDPSGSALQTGPEGAFSGEAA